MGLWAKQGEPFHWVCSVFRFTSHATSVPFVTRSEKIQEKSEIKMLLSMLHEYFLKLKWTGKYRYKLEQAVPKQSFKWSHTNDVESSFKILNSLRHGCVCFCVAGFLSWSVMPFLCISSFSFLRNPRCKQKSHKKASGDWLGAFLYCWSPRRWTRGPLCPGDGWVLIFLLREEGGRQAWWKSSSNHLLKEYI